MFHNAASAEVDLFLRDVLKVLILFQLNRLLFFIDIKVIRKKEINHPGRDKNLVNIR